MVCSSWHLALCTSIPFENPQLTPITARYLLFFKSFMCPHSPTITLLHHSQSLTGLRPCLECFYMENKPTYTKHQTLKFPPFRVMASEEKRRGEEDCTEVNCKCSCLGNVYLDIQCHTFLGCCCFAQFLQNGAFVRESSALGAPSWSLS